MALRCISFTVLGSAIASPCPASPLPNSTRPCLCSTLPRYTTQLYANTEHDSTLPSLCLALPAPSADKLCLYNARHYQSHATRFRSDAWRHLRVVMRRVSITVLLIQFASPRKASPLLSRHDCALPSLNAALPCFAFALHRRALPLRWSAVLRHHSDVPRFATAAPCVPCRY
jgi:hypothetical protein